MLTPCVKTHTFINCFVELLWGVGVVLLGIGCFGDKVGAGDDQVVGG